MFFNCLLSCRLHLITETWSKDACELIDYESTSLVPANIITKEEGFVYRKFNSVFVTKDSKLDVYCQNLFNISINDNDFNIKPNLFCIDSNTMSQNSENPAWFVYKASKCPEKGKKYRINQGDIVKIGRITCRVKEIKFIDINNNSLNTNINMKETLGASQLQTEKNIKEPVSTRTMKKSVKSKKKAKKVCRICYGEEDTDDNPLVHPCHCSGTMKNIHLECLRQWLSTRTCQKVSSSNDNPDSAVFQIKQVECELCKTKLPDYIRHLGKLYEILDFHSEFDNYITLESLTLDKHNNKYLYVVSLDDKNTIKVGRGRDSNLVLSDISVSRVHCLFHRENKTIYIEDNDSKFGTLVLIQSPVVHIDENVPLHFQVGRTYFMTKIKKPFTLFGCCSITESADEYIYQRQNVKNIDYQKKIVIEEEKDNDSSDEEEEKEINENKKQEPFLKVIEDDKEEDDKGIILTDDKGLRARKSTIVMDNVDYMPTITNGNENVNTNNENLVPIPFRQSNTREMN